jgi:rfaE bifunctional protein nucleotidyltransferase chain/domain
MKKNKIYSISNLEIKLKKIKKENKKIVLAHGVFDLLHIGHIKYLKKAKSFGDILIVSITSDKFVNKGPGRPYFEQRLRAEFLESIEVVDYVVINNFETSEKIISTIKPNYYIKGQDYKNLQKKDKNLINEIKAVKRAKGIIKIIDEVMFSSSKIINDNLNEQKNTHKKIINDLKNKNIIQDLNNKIDKKILVMGDQIIDEFTFVKSLGKSRKNNIISSRYIKKESQVGGANFIYKNIKQFVSQVDFLNINSSYELKKNKNNLNVKLADNQIIYKKRFVDFYNLNKIFQINKNDKINLKKADYKKIINKLKKVINNYDILIVCDFGHGLFQRELLAFINKLKIYKIINCQTNSSNFGFNKYKKYTNADILICDEDEFRLSIENESEEIGQLLSKNKFPYKQFIVTSGKNGCYLKEKNKVIFVESFEINNFVDSIGSGDIFFSFFSILNNLKTYKQDEKLMLAHLAAAIHSQSFANEKVVKKDIYLKSIKALIS